MAEERALVIYDGDCAFCRLWIDAWREETGDRVHFAPSQEIAKKFPDVPREKYARAVQLIDEDGTRYEGAEAVFRVLAKRPGRGWLIRVYEAPAVAPVTEWAYRLIARHRPLCLKLTRLLWGEKIERPRYGLTARIFLQALAVVYFVAFVSLLPQLPGLVGEQGMLPAASYLSAVHAQRGGAAYWLVPTLAWFNAHAGALQLMAIAGALLALLAFGGILLAPCFLLMWILYLSLVSVGQDFTAFQWDSLLLEAGFLAIFLVPFRRSVSYRSRLEASSIVMWLYRFLLFRLTFSSGAVKLLSGDRSWRNLSALSFHFETQPLPTALAWYADHLPSWILKLMTLGTLGIELIVPFLFLLPRRARRLGAAITVCFQLLLIATGNFAFFNWLTLALCLALLDDGWIERFWPYLAAKAHPDAALRPARQKILAGLAVLMIALGLTHLVLLFTPVPAPALALTVALEPFRISNDYGLFAVMTTSRPEIMIEGSNDGLAWRAYPWKWQPDDVKRAPGFVAPFQPRLDWQMWFAALGGSEQNPWTVNLALRLLQGSKPVLALFASNPFPDAPPRLLRMTLYTYRFTTPAERAKDGAWWRRELKTAYLPTFSLTGGSP